jgi:hypothetical protein
VFVLQTDRLWNTILWQLSVYFHHSWRIKKLTLHDKLLYLVHCRR